MFFLLVERAELANTMMCLLSPFVNVFNKNPTTDEPEVGSKQMLWIEYYRRTTDRRRAMAIKPSNPELKSQTLAGTGTGATSPSRTAQTV